MCRRSAPWDGTVAVQRRFHPGPTGPMCVSALAARVQPARMPAARAYQMHHRFLGLLIPKPVVSSCRIALQHHIPP